MINYPKPNRDSSRHPGVPVPNPPIECVTTEVNLSDQFKLTPIERRLSCCMKEKFS